MAETRYASRFRRVVARLRARGFTVVEEPGCYSRTVGSKDLLGVESHVPHHTAGGNDASDRRVVRDGRAGLRGPLSQLLTETDGTLRLLATGYANHAGPTRRRYEGNSWSIGNEIVSRGRSTADFTDAQVRAAEALAEELAREFGYDLQSWTVGHKEIAVPAGRKVDPAFSMPAFRGRLSTAPAIPAVPLPTPQPEEGFLMALSDAQQAELYEAVTGKLLPATARIDTATRQSRDLLTEVRERQEVGLADQRSQSIALAATRAAQTDVVTASRESAAAVVAEIATLPPEVARAVRLELARQLAAAEVGA